MHREARFGGRHVDERLLLVEVNERQRREGADDAADRRHLGGRLFFPGVYDAMRGEDLFSPSNFANL